MADLRLDISLIKEMSSCEIFDIMNEVEVALDSLKHRQVNLEIYLAALGRELKERGI